MFLKVATNNRAEIVLRAFVEAINEFGLPLRVRLDKGGENIMVATYMIEHCERGPGRPGIFALHFVFTPIIQEHLNMFCQGCRAPQQLWILGLQGAEDDDLAITGLDVRFSHS